MDAASKVKLGEIVWVWIVMVTVIEAQRAISTSYVATSEDNSSVRQQVVEAD